MDKTEMIKDSMREKIKRLEIIEDERKQFFRECERKSNELFERKNKLLRIIEEKILIAKHYIQQSSVDTSEGVNNLNYLASIYYDEINLSFQKHLKELEEKKSRNDTDFKEQSQLLEKEIEELYYKIKRLNCDL